MRGTSAARVIHFIRPEVLIEMSRVGQTYFVIAVWRAKEQKSALREVLGANRRQSQQGRLDVGLRFNRGFQRANDLYC